MEENGDDADWPDDSEVGRKLSTLQETLFCPICFDWFTNPQMLKCGHTFCSICIRKHMDPQINRTSASTCAVCRETADTFDLRKNTVVCNAVQCFRGMRTNLMDLLASKGTKADVDDDCIEVVNPKLATGSSSQSGIVITKRVPHFSFHGLKRDKVKSTLVQLSGESRVKLRMDGEKEAMEKRVREFVHLYNAQIGSARPLSLEQVIKAVNDNETQLDRESSKTARTINKLEKVKNGEVVQEVEDNFARLTQKIKEQKAAALRKLEASKLPAPSTDQPAAPPAQESAEVAQSSSSSASAAEHASTSSPCGASRHAVAGGSGGSAGQLPDVEQSAQVVSSLQQLLRRGYDWGPWRVVMSRKLARPFFFNTTTGVGQFAIPPDLQVALDEDVSEDGITVSKDEESSQVKELVSRDGGAGCQEVLQSRRTRSSKIAQPVAVDAVDNVAGAGGKRPHAPAVSAGIEEEEEESPFHMLADSQGESQSRFGSQASGYADPTNRRVPRASGSGSTEASSSSSGARGSAASQASAISGATTVAYIPTAVSTAMDLPQATPYPFGAASLTSSASAGTGTPFHATPAPSGGLEEGIAATASSGRRSGGAIDGIGFGSASSSQIPGLFATRSSSSGAATEWSCETCTYLNGFHTYACEMCGGVDKTVQSRFSKPLLRSSAPASQHSTGAKKKFSQGGGGSSCSKKARR